MANPEIKTIEWCGYEWETCMENGRPIHPDNPWYYIAGDMVYKSYDDRRLCLNLSHSPKTIIWWNKEWSELVDYHSTIACGLVKSVKSFPKNNSFECEVLMPVGDNLWFSFWLTACDNWSPEIDVFEGYTDKNGSLFDKLGLHWRFPFIYRNVRLESNVHYSDNKGVHRQIGPEGVHEKYFNDLRICWNRFRCEWRDDSIQFFVNDRLVRTVKDRKVLSRMDTAGMHVIFNIWPNDKFDLSKTGDIQSLLNTFQIRNFKVEEI